MSAFIVPFALAVSCSDDSGNTAATEGSGANSSGSVTASGGSNSGGGINAGGATAAGGGPLEISECQGHVYECGDLIDNDMDGLTDSQDPDCLGPCDNTEDSYYGGIPGQNAAPCKMDCYFDQDTGSGNDDCYWSHKCDPNSISPNYYPEPQNGSQCEYDTNANIPGTSQSCAELFAAQSQECLDYCGPLTPNGCDCFGCCELPASSGNYVWLGSQGINGDTVCTDADVNDPTICHPCLPVAACQNDCGVCELCIGKTTLPPECFDPDGGMGAGGGGNTRCPMGVQECGLPGDMACPQGYTCITGCCYENPT